VQEVLRDPHANAKRLFLASSVGFFELVFVSVLFASRVDTGTFRRQCSVRFGSLYDSG
jgi:hypothetical protein